MRPQRAADARPRIGERFYLRTATVRTLEPTLLYALDRDPFLLSVTGHTDSHHEGLDVAARFLAHSEAAGQAQS